MYKWLEGTQNQCLDYNITKYLLVGSINVSQNAPVYCGVHAQEKPPPEPGIHIPLFEQGDDCAKHRFISIELFFKSF